MTEQEFLDKVVESGVSLYTKPKPTGKSRYGYSNVLEYKNRKKEAITLDDYLQITWVSGGVTGGSCWDDGTHDNHRPVSGEPEPDFTDLDNLLATVCPNISFLLYRKVMRDANVETGSNTEYEYYGNSTEHSYKRLQLGNLYKALAAAGQV
jgi:hypothetical protein